jgi:hypothetical protein
VPETYRNVPRVVETDPGTCREEKICRKKIDFEEVCVPGSYEGRSSPDICRRYALVEASPARTDWVKVKCCGANTACCYRPVDVPPSYKVCEKTETEEGIEYCAFTPPQYDIVQRDRYEVISRPVYTPAQYGVVYEKQLFDSGHYEWQKRYTGCSAPRSDCPKATCTPTPCGPSGGGSVPEVAAD